MWSYSIKYKYFPKKEQQKANAVMHLDHQRARSISDQEGPASTQKKEKIAQEFLQKISKIHKQMINY